MHRMIGALTCGLLAASLAACERKSDAADDAAESVNFEPKEVPAEFAEGKRLFDARCSECHGDAGAGTENGPPLVHIYYEPNHHGDVAFQRAVALGVVAHHWRFGPMPKIDGLSEADVRAITAYVRWLQREAGIY